MIEPLGNGFYLMKDPDSAGIYVLGDSSTFKVGIDWNVVAIGQNSAFPDYLIAARRPYDPSDSVQRWGTSMEYYVIHKVDDRSILSGPFRLDQWNAARDSLGVPKSLYFELLDDVDLDFNSFVVLNSNVAKDTSKRDSRTRFFP